MTLPPVAAPAAGASLALDPSRKHGRSRAALSLIDRRPARSLIDWGCGEGEFADELARAADLEVIACDVDDEYVAALRERCGARVKAVLVDDLQPRVQLPDHTVDVVTCLDVLEHMGDASRLGAMTEIHRLLRRDGRLVVTVPHRGILHWADPENLKFRVPRLHRAVYRLARGGAAYEATYGAASRFGNYSRDSRWHHHFSRQELVAVLDPWFCADKTIYFGLIHPVVRYLMYAHEMAARWLGRKRDGWLNRMLWALYIWDADVVAGKWSYYLGMSFIPRTSVEPSEET
jgi:SAM-dependent methyltransferase